MEISGTIRNIKFLIDVDGTINVWKPNGISVAEFKPDCNYLIRYLIDEGFSDKKKCKIKIIGKKN